MPNYAADDVNYIKQKMDELERERINSISKQPEDEPQLTMEEAEAPPTIENVYGLVGFTQIPELYYFTDAMGQQWVADGLGNITKV